MEPQRDRDWYWRSLSESSQYTIAEDYRGYPECRACVHTESAIAFHRAAPRRAAAAAAAAAGTAEKVKQSSQVSGSNRVHRVPRKFRG